MVSTLPAEDAVAIQKAEFIRRFIEDIRCSSESLLSRTKEAMDVILQQEKTDETPVAKDGGTNDTKLSEEWLQRLIRVRLLRDSHFPKNLFADPTWDMVLDLTLGHVAGKQISVSSLCVASGAPATTALRRIDDLVDSGLAKRIKDPSDGRRVFIALTDEGLKRVTGFLDALALAFRDTAPARRTGVGESSGSNGVRGRSSPRSP